MNKTPFLDGFPTSLFGRAKARGQALLRQARCQAIERCPGQLSGLFADVITPELVEGLAANQREREFPDPVTFWAFLGQVLSEDGSCGQAVAEVQHWRQQSGQRPPSADTSSYCKARRRLPQELLDGVHRHLVATLDRQMPSQWLWHGRVAKAVDGSSVQLPDTPENQRAYPQPPTQREGCGFPVMQFGAILNLCTGAWEHLVLSSMDFGDHTLLDAAFDHLTPGDVLVADRAFGSYEMMARLGQQDIAMVARHHHGRKLDWRRGKKVGPDQRIVVWEKPRQQPSGSRLGAEQWESLPEQIDVRLIRVRGRGREGEARTLYLATTLVDTELYPAGDIADLYCQRWEIELRLRDLKTTMGMELLRTKTPEMARKEMAMFIIAYNALRVLMLQASVREGVSLWRISFKGTMQVVAAWDRGFEGLRHQPVSRRKLYGQLLEQIAKREVPHRPGRQEPRAKKRRPKPFPLLMEPRRAYKERLRKNSQRNPSRKVA